MFTRSRLGVVAAILCLVAAACGNDKPSSGAADTTAPSTTTTAVHSQTITITPSTGLHNNDTVHVVGRGFTPNQNGLGIVQCGKRKDVTNEGDCNIAGIKLVNSDAAGVVTADFNVMTGPIGGNGAKCDKDNACTLSVTQLTLNPAEVAPGPITFA